MCLIWWSRLAVVATLIHKAIGDRLTCMFIDNGLLETKWSGDVMKVFQKFSHEYYKN